MYILNGLMLFAVWVPHQKEKVLFSAVYRVIWVISTGFHLVNFQFNEKGKLLNYLFYTQKLAEAADKSIFVQKAAFDNKLRHLSTKQKSFEL